MDHMPGNLHQFSHWFCKVDIIVPILIDGETETIIDSTTNFIFLEGINNC